MRGCRRPQLPRCWGHHHLHARWAPRVWRACAHAYEAGRPGQAAAALAGRRQAGITAPWFAHHSTSPTTTQVLASGHTCPSPPLEGASVAASAFSTFSSSCYKAVSRVRFSRGQLRSNTHPLAVSENKNCNLACTNPPVQFADSASSFWRL